MGLDLFEYAVRDYVVVFDAYSNYLTVAPLNDKTSRHIIIEQINKIFFKIGFPTIIICDHYHMLLSSIFEMFWKDIEWIALL